MSPRVPHQAMPGTFHVAWWPRSRDLESQLPGLLAVLTARPDPLARIDRSAVGDDTMIVNRGDRDAVRDDNDASAERTPAATGVTPAGRTRVPPGAPGS